jgi:hypothetical protein
MDNYPLAEQKLIYRILHQHLIEHPQLMDSEFLHDLQRSLQKQAQAEGVDVSDHGAWDEWLGNIPVPCDVRVRQRRTFG